MPTVFNCSMCSAPLDVTTADGATVRCPYCGNTSILPEELRTAPSGGGGVTNMLGGSLSSIVSQAVKMGEIAKLARAGKKIEAIKLHRETFGTSLQQAKEAVEQIEKGQIALHADFHVGNASAHSLQAAQLTAQVASQQAKKVGRWVVFFILMLVAVPIIIAAVSIIGAFKAVQHTSDVISKSMPGRSANGSTDFATAAFQFGSEGIGAGQFKDARSIAVDGQGRIYVGEYLGGRVQVFDAQGNFQSQWMVDPKKPLFSLAADRKGTVYVVHPGAILRYDGATGNLLGEVAKPAGSNYEFYTDAYVALDGSLYAIGSNSNIIRIGPDGQARVIINVKQKIGDDVDFEKVAVNGSGYIYALEGRHEGSVYKFAPDGKFLNKFGGKGREAGQLETPEAIATDGQGRVYVSDVSRGVQVFDNNGRYLGSFGGYTIFGMAVNDRNEIFAAERNNHTVVKYVLNK